MGLRLCRAEPPEGVEGLRPPCPHGSLFLPYSAQASVPTCPAPKDPGKDTSFLLHNWIRAKKSPTRWRQCLGCQCLALGRHTSFLILLRIQRDGCIPGPMDGQVHAFCLCFYLVAGSVHDTRLFCCPEFSLGEDWVSSLLCIPLRSAELFSEDRSLSVETARILFSLIAS